MLQRHPPFLLHERAQYTDGAHTITYLICSWLNPLSLAYIDYGATFLWVHAAAMTIYWAGGPSDRMQDDFWQIPITMTLVERWAFLVTFPMRVHAGEA